MYCLILIQPKEDNFIKTLDEKNFFFTIDLYTRNYTTPIFLLLDKYIPEIKKTIKIPQLHGTASKLVVDNRSYLITAKHIADNISKTEFNVFVENSKWKNWKQTDAQKYDLSKVDITKLINHPSVDVSLIEIKQKFCVAADMSHISNAKKYKLNWENSRFRMHGFPLCQEEINKKYNYENNSLIIEHQSDLVSLLLRPLSKPIQLDIETGYSGVGIQFNYEKETVLEDNLLEYGFDKNLNPKGFSGASIWGFLPKQNGEIWSPEDAAIFAIQSSYSKKDQWLTAFSSEHVIELL